MSEIGSRACAECGNVQNDGDFCEKCGAQLPPTVGDSGFAPVASAEIPPPPPPIPPHPIPPHPIPPTPTAAAAEAAAESQPTPVAPPAPPPAAGPAPQAVLPAAAPPPQYAATPPGYVPPPPPPHVSSPEGAGGYAPPPSSPGNGGTGFFGALFDLSFTEFVTPKIIKFLFIITLVAIALSALAMIVMGFVAGIVSGLFVLLIATPVAVLFYVLLARLWLEVVVVLFRIEEHLADMAKKD